MNVADISNYPAVFYTLAAHKIQRNLNGKIYANKKIQKKTKRYTVKGQITCKFSNI
jgi:hypothetical protein